MIGMKLKLSSLKKKADKLWSERIRSIGQCEYCNGKKNLNAHHIISRSYTNLRWDLRNGICLDCNCHKFNRSNSFHNNPFVAVDWITRYRERDVCYLKEMVKLPIKKLTTDDMLEIIKTLVTK